jgi:multicomponent Na+:H+ antiporter subunit E
MRLLKRASLFGALWLVLTHGAPNDWLFGALLSATAAVLSVRLLPPARHRLTIAGLVRLIPGFLSGSLRGGIDVARIALHPTRTVNPGWIRHATTLPRGVARMSFGAELSLMPGTLSAGNAADDMLIHVLSLDAGVRQEIARVESRVVTLLEPDPESAGSANAEHP